MRDSLWAPIRNPNSSKVVDLSLSCLRVFSHIVQVAIERVVHCKTGALQEARDLSKRREKESELEQANLVCCRHPPSPVSTHRLSSVGRS